MLAHPIPKSLFSAASSAFQYRISLYEGAPHSVAQFLSFSHVLRHLLPIDRETYSNAILSDPPRCQSICSGDKIGVFVLLTLARFCLAA